MKGLLISQLKSCEEYFLRSINCLAESDSAFVPVEGMIPVAQQVAHVAQTLDWFKDALNSKDGFDLNFEQHWLEVTKISSLTAAKEWFMRSMKELRYSIDLASDAQLLEPFPDGPIMGGLSRMSIVGGVLEHTAHHRGNLAVYSRLLGKKPSMPYMDT